MNTATETKAIEDISSIYDQVAEQEAIALILEPRYVSMLNAVHELVRTTFPAMEDFRLDDAATRRLLVHAAEQVVRIDVTTRSAIAEMLMEGQRLGLSSWEIANGNPKIGFRGIEQLFSETWKNRALTVARNELLEAQHFASLERYKATGLVDRVTIRDGTGASPDAPCIDRNGRTVPLSSDPQRLHVNCSVCLVPVLRGDAPQSVPPVR